MSSDKSRHLVPDFLIIGAQKAGTTTLFRDLIGHPKIFLPEDKEPWTLTKFGDEDEAILSDYASLFLPAKDGQLKGEASTSYTMRPHFDGVAERALRICGTGLRLIYLQREPVKRLISQYQHEYGLREIEGTLEDCVLTDSRFVDISSYDFQLEPWLQRFPAEQLLILSFEEYVRDRAGTLAKVARFLDVDVALMQDPDVERVHNPSDGKPVATGFMRKLIESKFYQRVVKPRVPWEVRDKIMAMVLPAARKSENSMSPDVEMIIRKRLAERNSGAVDGDVE